MNTQPVAFLLSAALGLLAWAVVCLRYLWPWLRHRPLRDAAEPILYLHLFRYIGLAFIAPGVVGPGLAPAWAHAAAWGDVVSASLAGVALLSQRSAAWRPALWLFSAVGMFDLLRAAATGPVHDVPKDLQATFFIPVLAVPLLVWTHVMLIALLCRREPSLLPSP